MWREGRRHKERIATAAVSVAFKMSLCIMCCLFHYPSAFHLKLLMILLEYSKPSFQCELQSEAHLRKMQRA